MADYLPKYDEGDSVTFTAGSGGVTGGLLVDVTGATAGAGSTVAGVAAFDAAAGAPVTVIREGVQRLKASGTIAVGDPLKAAAGGTVVKYVVGTDAVNLYIGDAWSAGASGALVDAVFRF